MNKVLAALQWIGNENKERHWITVHNIINGPIKYRWRKLVHLWSSVCGYEMFPRWEYTRMYDQIWHVSSRRIVVCVVWWWRTKVDILMWKVEGKGREGRDSDSHVREDSGLGRAVTLPNRRAFTYICSHSNYRVPYALWVAWKEQLPASPHISD